MEGCPNYIYQCQPCANCGKENGVLRNSTAWGHSYYCCSEACGIRLKKRLENGMITHKQIEKRTKQERYLLSDFLGDRHIYTEREELFRVRIKQLENQLKQNGIKLPRFTKKHLKLWD